MMQKWLLSLSLVATVLSVQAQSARETDTETAFTHVSVLPMDGGQTLLENQTVIVKKGKIAKIGPADKVKPGKKAIIIDGTGKFLLPGLAEMHAHIPTPDGNDDALVKETLFLYLSNGVTTIRGMLGAPYHLELKKMAETGQVLSPRIFTSSPSINGNTVTTLEEARQKVTQYKKDGYDFLKIHPGVKLDVFDEVVRTAKSVGISFAGHVPAQVGIRHALQSGYASVDHLDGYVEGLVPEAIRNSTENWGFFGYGLATKTDEQAIPELSGLTKGKGVWVVPTQSLFTRWFSPEDPNALGAEPEMKYMPPKTVFQWRQSKAGLINSPDYNEAQWKEFIAVRQKMLRALNRTGVGLLLGSDAPQVFNVPGFSLRHEVQSLKEAGLPVDVILQSGTANPARFFGMTGQFGVVTVGASADFILADGNPLENLDNLWKQSGVMVRGQWLTREFIAGKLAEIADKYAR